MVGNLPVVFDSFVKEKVLHECSTYNKPNLVNFKFSIKIQFFIPTKNYSDTHSLSNKDK